MSIEINSEKGRKLAEILHNSFSTVGIFGRTEMPEDVIPKGIQRGSQDHLLFITFSVSIDYTREAPQLWESAKNTYEDPETRYLFNPESVYETSFNKIRLDMQKHKLSKKYNKDAQIWRTIALTFYKKWDNDPLNFIEDCDYDSLTILRRLRYDTHEYNGKSFNDFRNLRGDKIGPLWVRMLRDNVGINKLKRLDKVPIPVDRHIAKASLTTGIVSGVYNGRLEGIFEIIREAWFESVQGLKVGKRDMIALDVDEPLWHLSKYGCKNRDKLTGKCTVFNLCEAREYCINGEINVKKDNISMRT